MIELRKRQCVPCEGGTPALTPDVARELLKLDADTLPEPARGWVTLLKVEYGWRREAPTVRGGGSVAGAARASTSQRLDPLRPTGEEGVWPPYQVGGWFETGPVAAELRLLGDTYFVDDPDRLEPGQSRVPLIVTSHLNRLEKRMDILEDRMDGRDEP